MRRPLLALAIFGVLLLPLVSAAQTTSAPKPDFAPMTYFVGLWNCTQTKAPTPKLVGAKFSIAGATDAGGYWEYLDTQNGRINITRDGPDNHWTFIYMGNGGDYSVMTTPGWVGNTLTLSEVVTYGHEPRGQARFTKVNDSMFRANYADKGSAGAENFETACTRVK